MLDVHHIEQLADGFCLPACAQMVLAFYGVQVDQVRLANQMNVIAPMGTSIRNITRIYPSIPKSLGVSVGEADDERPLLAALINNCPPILRVMTGDLSYWAITTTHALVLVGIEGAQAFVNDPAFSDAPTLRRQCWGRTQIGRAHV